MKRRAQPRPAPQSEYIFQVESLSHEGRGIAHYGSYPTIRLKSMARKSLSVMPCQVKPFVPALPVKSKTGRGG